MKRTLIHALGALASLAVACASANAQVQRNFPATALRGALTIRIPPEIVLNGAPARLAPGARIRGQDNMMVMSGALAGAPLLVHYTLDTSGQVRDVWILRSEEAAKRPWPTTPEQASEWIFDPAAQTWTRP
ncbi:MAG: hypothetical protein ABIO45_02260 [Burkholderiaceae bacterium]